MKDRPDTASVVTSTGRTVINLTDSDMRFLFGEREADGAGAESMLPRAFKGVVEYSGAGAHLRKLGFDPADFPDDAVPVHAFPESLRLPEGQFAFDLISFVLSMFAEKKAEDERFEKATDRWRKVPDRVSGYIPADAGSIRWTMMSKNLMKPFDFDRMPPEEGQARVSDAIGASYSYLATPFFIPAAVALDVVTGAPLEPMRWQDIRLPARHVMVFHDGVPLTVVAGDDDTVEAYAAGNGLIRRDALLLGALIAADDDLAVDHSLAFLILAKPTAQCLPSGKPVYSWRPIPVPMAVDSAAANVLWNYAALLSWEDWSLPPAVPDARGKSGSRGHLRGIARSPEGQRGAFHGVRVLNYRPPGADSLKDAEPHEKRPGRELRYQHDRRAHYRYRVRVGIRDENDRLVGPVFGPNAVEGVTFTRRPKFIRRKTVREDLPERPQPEERVYRVSGTVQRGGGVAG